MEAGACYYPEIDFDLDLEPMTDRDKPLAAVVATEIGAIENSACFCQFADREITLPQWVDLFLTRWPVTVGISARCCGPDAGFSI
jgi:hypothetical protein